MSAIDEARRRFFINATAQGYGFSDFEITNLGHGEVCVRRKSTDIRIAYPNAGLAWAQRALDDLARGSFGAK